MNLNNALNVLGLGETATLEEVKAAYKKAAGKYHPDRNPAGEEMMKLVNASYAALQEYFSKNPDLENIAFYGEDQNYDYGEAINEALNLVLNLTGVTVELCGAWLWIGGETKEHKEDLKAAGFKWASKKKLWYFRPEGKKSKRRYGADYTMDKIRDNYGSKSFKQAARQALNY